MKTLYQVLGVRRQASLDEIEQPYRQHLNRHIASSNGRKLSKKDQQRLHSLRGAFLILSSPSRRQTYDRELADYEQRRNRLLDAGGALLAVASLLVGVLLLASGDWVGEKPASAQAAKGMLASGKEESAGGQARR
ncbi:MAG TPA: DnaJ domain-containing protein [Noviherbaspirillum sp.]|jgi:curved DNA-binding protein CbpA|uniref:DnaJ domain-containing protein n=1 Tax=Noviherbaspirillum sp. TaxID=1926288 RepID=UPI002F926314